MKEMDPNWVEPQAQEAVQLLEAKGYRLGTLAGLAGNPANGKQAILFEYPSWKPGMPVFDDATAEKLKSAGFKQYSGAHPIGTIGFEFEGGKDDAAIRAKWRKLAEMLPSV